MRPRTLLLALVLLSAAGLVALSCERTHRIDVTSPSGDVTTGSFAITFELVGGPYALASLDARLNGMPLVLSGGPEQWSASPTGAPQVDPGEPLRDENLLSIEVRRENEHGRGKGAKGGLVRSALRFAYAIPKARAYRIERPSDCPVSGPLAHRRVGDYCLENDGARFVVQDVTAPERPSQPTPRDLYSVGAFGGNLIDAVLPGNPTTDNFLEFQAMLNVETVANYQSLQVVNDGQNGTPAVLRVCGPDDLLDFANPSSQLIDIGLTPPAGTDDTDLEIDACTTYTLRAGDSHVRVDTEVFNNQGGELRLLVGDWMNAAGEVDGFFKPGPGVGEGVTSPLASAGNQGLTWFAETRIQPPDRFEYGYLPRDDTSVGGYVVISGVAVIIHDLHPAAALLGLPSPFLVPAGGSRTFTRYFSVGDGSGNSVQELANQLDGRATGTVQGCVTVGGAPAQNAKVTIGTLAFGQLRDALAHFVTDAEGCYAGRVEAAAGPAIRYGAVAGRQGAPYIGGGPTPPVTIFNLFPAGDVETLDFALPATGHLTVDVRDETGAAVPSRITVVGLDPSPEVIRNGQALPGFGVTRLGLLNDVNDELPFGIAAFAYTGADGVASFDLEPGSYHVFASRGTEYSAWSTSLPGGAGPVAVAAGVDTALSATIARVLDTTGFVSSDFHVHGISSADSQVSDFDRAEGFAGEGVDNLVSTDHHAHKDYAPMIRELGLDPFLASTIGEEITTFDYGHFNAYPLTVDESRPSGGSTDWAVAAPPGRDFPSYGAYSLPPAGIYELATTQPTATAATTVQINHIGSHFAPLKIETGVAPPTDEMSAADRATRRLDPASPPLGQLFFAFPALELWNGNDRGHQGEFLDERIGIWMNLLDQGIRSTAIADSDTHTFRNLRQAGARSWTAAPAARDEPARLFPAEVAESVDAGRVVGGQGVFVRSRLIADDGSGAQADHGWRGSTSVGSANGSVIFEVSVQSPAWAAWDTIEVYSNAYGNSSSVPAGAYLYAAAPLASRQEGDCDPSTTGDGDFDVDVVVTHPDVPGAERRQATVSFAFPELGADTWFVAVVRGSDGVCGPMFPIYPDDLNRNSNLGAPDVLAALVDGNVGESGTMALGFTNALYYEH